MLLTDPRVLGGICFRVARGEDVSEALSTLKAQEPNLASLVAAARAHRLIPLLSAGLSNAGMALPDGVAQPSFWRSQEMLIRAQLVALDAALHERGTRVVLLKGSVQLFRPLYPRAGMRTMADVDLLITDVEALACFEALGYGPALGGADMPKTLELEKGEHHLTPVRRPRDLVTIEPHVLAASVENVHLVGSLQERTSIAPGLKATALPHRIDQLIIAVVHGIQHDRNTMHGGLFLRALIECELLYERLTVSEKDEAQALLAARGGADLWDGWRGLADWCLHGDESARQRNRSAARLIREFRLRNEQRFGTLAAALSNLGLMVVSPRFLRSGRWHYFTKKLLDRAFWARFRSKIRSWRGA